MLAHYAGNRRSFKAVDGARISHWRLTIEGRSLSRTTETKLTYLSLCFLSTSISSIMSEQAAMSKANADMAQGQVLFIFHHSTVWLKQRRFGKAHYFQSDFGCLANWIILFVIGIRLERYAFTILDKAHMLTACIGNSTFAAITAIVAANLVLVAYIITAILEDRTNATSGSQIVEKETKKDKWIAD